MRLIGLCGRKGSGKSTVGRMLCDEYGMHELAFADPLKRGLQHMFGFDEDQLWGDRKDVVDPAWGLPPRHLLQFIGTEIVRDLLPRTFGWTDDARGSPWVFRMERELRRRWERDPQALLVITDVRFPDEAALIRRFGGVVWHVERPQSAFIADIADAHVSEGCPDLRPERRICNDGTLEELCSRAKAMYHEEFPSSDACRPS